MTTHYRDKMQHLAHEVDESREKSCITARMPPRKNRQQFPEDSAIGTRLREWREFYGYSLDYIAAATDTSKSAASRAELGRTANITTWIGRYAKALNIEADKLLAAPPIQSGTEPTSNNSIAVYDIAAAAGHGAIIEYDNGPLYHLTFPRDFLRRLTRATGDDIVIISVHGDSMEPTLRPGDQVMIDRTVKRIGKDGIYVIRITGESELMIKRCQRDFASSKLSILSDNPAYQPFHGIPDDRIDVLGRAIWIGRGL